MEEERRTVIRPGATLAVYSYGPAPAPGIPTILFVHGYPDDHTLFEYAVPALSTDCRVITYDTRLPVRPSPLVKTSTTTGCRPWSMTSSP